MTLFDDRGDRAGELDELESIILGAGRFVTASDDLRPRVLEAARAEQGRRRARFRIGGAALVAALLAVIVSSAERVNISQLDPLSNLDYADSDWMFSRAQACAADDKDIGWGLVEAFTELRSRQSRLMGMSSTQ